MLTIVFAIATAWLVFSVFGAIALVNEARGERITVRVEDES